ncbi:MAG: N-6 DNA methylase [Gemmatimonadota bacterium]|nr:N-6 DNA methylase [Gemmatimonadota bacterium]
MLTLRSAAGLLAAADSPAALSRLVATLGVGGAPRPLDAARREAIGLPSTFDDAHVAAGPGHVRALTAVVRQGDPLREQLPRLAARLQSRAPQVQWLVAVADARWPSLALAAWSGATHPPRVRSLLVDRTRIVDSDAETLCALAAAAGDDDVLMHLRWNEVLGRDALGNRFYRELEQRVRALADSASIAAGEEDRRTLALLHTSRLLFLAFLQAKQWLDDGTEFLARTFDACMAGGGGFHRRVLRPLFFGTLNTPVPRRAAAAHALGRIPFLNGGLFAPTPLERRYRRLEFSDEAFGAMIGELFGGYRFTAREDAATWTDAAIDPEMLGRAFESLMASHDRRDSGAFFTPQRLVEHVTDLALAHALSDAGASHGDIAALLAPSAESVEDPALRRTLARVTLLDPACGSGAFLVHALERLTELRIRLGERRASSDVKRDVVTTSLYGVDRNPMAVWLCELRLWLSVVIDCAPPNPMDVTPLPNLDRNIRVGDALAGAGFEGSEGATTPRNSRLVTLHRRYARASGARKSALSRALDHDERRRALAALDRAIAAAQHARRELLLSRRGRDLFGNRHGVSASDRSTLEELRTRTAGLKRERRRVADGGALPFSFGVHFGDVASRGGFDIVVGNPPWVRLHRVPPAERAALRRRFAVFRDAQWAPGATAAHASPGFAGQADLSALFVERGLSLLRPGGALALLVPAKLWRALAGGGVRRLLAERARLTHVEDLSDAPAAFDAAVYPSVVTARSLRRGEGVPAPVPAPTPVTVALHQGPRIATWTLPASGLGLDASPGSPWLLLPPPVRRAFDALAEAGVPMASSAVGRPLLGVKCGCNEAFVVERMDERADTAGVRAADGRTGRIEASMLRPVIRGETVRGWSARPSDEWIVWTCDDDGAPLDALPPLAARWLARYKRTLISRADARHTRHWWALFRTESAGHDAPRVVWADFGRRPRALILPAGDRTVPLNTCYVARCADRTDARVLAAVLNSAIAAAWLHVLAEPARGGFRRYLGWTMARLPLPADWRRARRVLGPLVREFEERRALESPPAAALTDAVLDAYGVRHADLAPLFAWNAS